MPRWSGCLPGLSSGVLRRRERLGLFSVFQHASDGGNGGAGLDRGGTGDAGNQRFPEFLGVAQIRVGLDQGLYQHKAIIPAHEHFFHRPETLELLQCPALRGMLSQDVRRAHQGAV